MKVNKLLKIALVSKMQMSFQRTPKSNESISILSMFKSNEDSMKKEIQVSPLETEFLLPDTGEIKNISMECNTTVCNN